jgi:hypothetical protein
VLQPGSATRLQGRRISDVGTDAFIMEHLIGIYRPPGEPGCVWVNVKASCEDVQSRTKKYMGLCGYPKIKTQYMSVLMG